MDLADLVTIQMMNDIERLLRALDSWDVRGAQKVVVEARERTTLPELASEIVRKCVSTQFGDRYEVFRELAQNSIDSYHGMEGLHSVRITLDDDRLSFRDWGCGMTMRQLVSNLLIPFNTDKEFDPTLIGKHGVGWYSVLDVGGKVVVKTGRDGYLSQVQVEFHEGRGWVCTVWSDRSDEVGTEVIAWLRTPLKESLARRKIRDFAGFVDAERHSVTFQGELLNDRRVNYRQVGRVVLSLDDTADSLSLWVDDEISGSGDGVGRVIFIQNGLTVKEARNPFPRGHLIGDIVDGLVKSGASFFVELPVSITLTKGRNDIVSSEQQVVEDLLEDAFEEYIIGDLLVSRRLLDLVDSSLSEVIYKMLVGGYKRVKRKRTITVHRPANLEKKESTASSILSRVLGDVPVKRPELSDSVAVHFERVSDIDVNTDVRSFREFGYDRFLDLAEERRLVRERDEILSKIKGVSDFSRRLVEKPFIPARLVVSGEHTDTMLSIADIVFAATLGILGDFFEEVDEEDGVYIDKRMGIIKSVLTVVTDEFIEHDPLAEEDELIEDCPPEDEDCVEESEIRKAPVDVDTDTPAPIDDGLGSDATDPSIETTSLDERMVKEELKQSVKRRRRKVVTSRVMIHRTSLDTFTTIMKDAGVAQEYAALLGFLVKVDTMISGSNKVETNPIMFHYYPKTLSDDVAHTDGNGISFNTSDPLLRKALQEVRDGKLERMTLLMLMDILIHEKAHSTMKWFTGRAHGPGYYEAKSRLKIRFLNHLMRNDIDLYEVAAVYVNRGAGAPYMSPSDLAELVDMVEE